MILKKQRFLTILFAFSVFLVTNCSRNFDSSPADDEPKPADSTPTGQRDTPEASEDSSNRVTLQGIAFTPPQEWVSETPSSRMRQAQYRLPKADGDSEDGELVVFFFPGTGGSVEQNMIRWAGQFRLPDGSAAAPTDSNTETSEANGLPLSVLDISGTYNKPLGAMMSETVAIEGYRMIAAVAETQVGPWFFKLTGPANTIDRWKSDIDRFLGTIGAQ